MTKNSLINIQKEIFHHIKKRAQDIEVDASEELQRYRLDQAKIAQQNYSIVGEEALIHSISPANVVYFGDFHTFDQNSRNVIRILRKTNEGKQNIQLGLELVHSKDQSSIDAFLGGHLTEFEFLESINYQESWRFPWGHYRQIFNFAKDEKVRIVGLNSPGSLTERDKHAAKLISNQLNRYPDEKMVVLFGEYHIVNDKLPKFVAQESKAATKQVIIHQNLDELYWKLAENNKGHELNVVQFNESEFAIQSSPPWVKYESMLYWYENILDDPEFDIHEIILQSNAERFGENNEEIFIYLLKGVTAFFRFVSDVKAEELEHFNLYDLDNFEYLHEKLEQDLSPNLLEFYKKLMEEGMAFKIPLQSSLYCPNYSINQLSFLCGVYSLSKMGPNYSDLELDFLKNPEKWVFPFFFQKSIIGFIGSKVINPYRKTDLYLDLKATKFSEQSNQQKSDIYSIVQKIIDAPDKSEKLLAQTSLFETYLIAKRAGFICGEVLFNQVQEENFDFFKKTIKQLINERSDFNTFTKTLQSLKTNSSLLNSKKRLF